MGRMTNRIIYIEYAWEEKTFGKGKELTGIYPNTGLTIQLGYRLCQP